MIQANASPVPKKSMGAATAGNKGVAPGKRHTREFIACAERQLTDLWVRGCFGNPCRTLARRLGCSQEAIARLIVGLYLQYQREAASLKVGLQSALAMAQEAGQEVWREAA